MRNPDLPPSRSFRVENWFRWVLDARDAGYSQADILFVLSTVGVLESMRAILANDEQLQEKTR